MAVPVKPVAGVKVTFWVVMFQTTVPPVRALAPVTLKANPLGSVSLASRAPAAISRGVPGGVLKPLSLLATGGRLPLGGNKDQVGPEVDRPIVGIREEAAASIGVNAPAAGGRRL